MPKQNGHTSFGLRLKTDGANPGATVAKEPTPSVNEIPSFLEDRRERRMRRVAAIAVLIAKKIEAIDEAKITIRDLERRIRLEPTVALRLELAHDRAVLETLKTGLFWLEQDIQDAARAVAS